MLAPLVIVVLFCLFLAEAWAFGVLTLPVLYAAAAVTFLALAINLAYQLSKDQSK